MSNNFPDGFRPMKGDLVQLNKVTFPCYVSPKIDGFRNIIGEDNIAYTSSLAEVPNTYVQEYFGEYYGKVYLQGLDGEIVVGSPCDPEIFRKSCGPLKRRDGEPDFTFWVFDDWTDFDAPFHKRLSSARHIVEDLLQDKRIKLVPQVLVHNMDELIALMSEHRAQGYEGSMIRDPNGPYKFGRSTVKQGWLLKAKGFVDYEAVIQGIEEAQENLNSAERDNFGRTKRSTHAENKVGKEMAGTIIVRGLNGPYAGKVFPVSCSTMSHSDRFGLWATRAEQNGKIITYTCLEHTGGYDMPRGAKFKRHRPDWDVEETKK